MDRVTVPSFLVAMFIAVAGMPLDVFLVNTGEMGIEHAQPWRSTAQRSLVQTGRRLLTRLRALCTGWRGHPLAMPAAILLSVAVVQLLHPVDALAQGVLLGNVAVFGAADQLKAARAAQVANRTRTLELNAKLSKGEALTDAERDELKTLRAAAANLSEAVTIAEEANEAERAEAVRLDAARQAAGAAGGTDDGDTEASRRTSVVLGKDHRADETKAPGFFGRQLQAVLSFAAKGGWSHLSKEEQRVLGSMLDSGNQGRILAGPTGLNTDVASDGGFLVGQERSSTILQRVYSQGEVISRVGRLPIGPGSNGMKLPAIDETSRADNSRFGGIVSGWLGQGNTLTAGKPKFREMDLKLRKVGAFVYATDEQIADAIALEGWINKNLPLELTFRVEDAVLNGLGAPSPQGALKSGAVLSVTRTTANRILYDDVKAMWLRMWAPCRKNAVWFVDQSCEGELEQLAIAVGTGGVLAPIYKPAGSVPGQVYATLYGRPVIPVEYMAALGTAGDIALVDLSEYTLIDKGGVDAAVSLHVAFLTDEQVFRFIYRVDGQLNWNAALTPKSGGDTLSCVVTLTA